MASIYDIIRLHGETMTMVIDARGLKHPEPLKKLKEHFSTMCSIDEYVDLLVDNENELKNVKIYAVMSGCEYEIEKLDGYYKIRIKSPCV